MQKKQPLTPEGILMFLIRALALLALVFFCLAWWHPWRAGGGLDWRWVGMAVACIALAAICAWGSQSLKR
ncbi:MAG: hypothetical protein JO069_06665 [Verrucomicrobia bacterium]|nr:hypothetical protein [Verrucomicrobiota bacterium]